eukprot:8341479-Prorocentrum_lima.AAC.1
MGIAELGATPSFGAKVLNPCDVLCDCAMLLLCDCACSVHAYRGKVLAHAKPKCTCAIRQGCRCRRRVHGSWLSRTSPDKSAYQPRMAMP